MSDLEELLRDLRAVACVAALSQPVEPAPAQDEREAFEAWAKLNHFGTQRPFANSNNYASGYTNFCWKAWQARANRPAQAEPAPAQTEQQPVAIPEAVRAWMMDVPLPDNEYGYRLTNRRDELLAAPIAQTAPQVPERLPVEPYQTVDRSSTNYKAGWNACRKAMLEGQAAPQPERWHAMSGDWRETSLAIHGERSGYIACGIPEDKAHAIIKAHNIGLPEECAAKEG